MTHKIIQPKDWLPAKGYANGVMVDEHCLYIGGQIGWNENQKFMAHDFIGQMEQILKNIVTICEAAGGKKEDIVRLTWFVKDKQEYLKKQKEVGETYRKILGKHFPAMTLVIVKDLLEDEALLEIEATAHLK